MHMGVVKSNGTISMWGYNAYGQLGDGTTTVRPTSVLSGTSTQWKMLSIGNSHTLAIRNDGTLWAWGIGGNARLGQGTDTNNKPNPVQVGTATNWVFCSAGESHSMAIDSTGVLYGWGNNTNYRAGLSTVGDYNAPSPVSTIGEWKSVSAGNTHSIGIKQNGTLWGWGYDGGLGTVGVGSAVSYVSIPTILDLGSNNWKQVSATTSHNLAVKNDGSLWSWGYGAHGRLGHGSETNVYTPTKVGSLRTWAYASAGYRHSVAIRFDGTLWAWGDNDYGQLGNGTTTQSNVPVQVGTETTWKQVYAGESFTVGLKKDGTIWSWGNGINGRLGNGATSGTVLVPTQIGVTANNVRLGSSEEPTWVIPDGTVVWDTHTTSGNGGRKLIKLNDNSMIALTRTTTAFYLHKSTDGGKTWFMLNQYTIFDLVDASLTTDGVSIYVGYTHGLSTTANGRYVSYQAYNSNGSMPYLVTNVDSGQSAIGNISLAMNKAGTEVHMAWASKNSTYPNSFNIRYAKGTINGDGSVTWGAVEQVTREINSAYYMQNPSIVIWNGKVRIYVESKYSSGNGIFQLNNVLDGHVEGSNNGLTLGNWYAKQIYLGYGYIQSSPSAVVDKNGVIHVAWDGADATHPSKQNIRYAKSTDGGVTWSTPVKLTSGNLYIKTAPSIAVDTNGKVAILYYGTDASSLANVYGVVTTASGGWSEDTKLTEVQTITSSNGLPSVMYDHSISGEITGIPPTIYYATNMIKYMGTYVTNKAPSIAVITENDETIYKGGVIKLDGMIRDADAGNVVTAKYKINNGVARAITTGISDGNTWIPFDKSLTVQGDKIYDGDTIVFDGLTEDTSYTIGVWSEDDKGGVSSTQNYSFNVILNILPTITMVSSVYPDMQWTMADSDGSIVRTSFAINGVKAYEATFPTGTQTYTLTPGKLSIGSNSIVIEAEDDAGAIKRRTFNVVLARTRIPETQLTANLEAESMAEVRLRMERTDALENIKLTRIIGGIS